MKLTNINYEKVDQFLMIGGAAAIGHYAGPLGTAIASGAASAYTYFRQKQGWIDAPKLRRCALMGGGAVLGSFGGLPGAIAGAGLGYAADTYLNATSFADKTN